MHTTYSRITIEIVKNKLQKCHQKLIIINYGKRKAEFPKIQK